MRSGYCLSVCLSVCLVLGVSFVSPGNASAYCIGATEDTCPAGSYHQITVRNIFFGTLLDVSGADHIVLGTLSGSLVACDYGTGALYGLYDETTSSWLGSSLNADSSACWGAGNDVIEVLDSSYDCGSFSLTAFGYGGYTFQNHGQAGSDVIYGGSGTDQLCGGSGGDQLAGRGGSDDLDGLSGNDTLEGGSGTDTLWGYTGTDCLYDTGSSDVLKGEAGDDLNVCIDNAIVGTVDCGANGGDTCNTSGESTNCTNFSASYSFVCSSIPAPPSSL